jgi:hypothetical protein
MWARLLSLQSHCEERRKTPRYEAERTTIAQFVRRFFGLEEFDEGEILRICGIIQVRGCIYRVLQRCTAVGITTKYRKPVN